MRIITEISKRTVVFFCQIKKKAKGFKYSRLVTWVQKISPQQSTYPLQAL